LLHGPVHIAGVFRPGLAVVLVARRASACPEAWGGTGTGEYVRAHLSTGVPIRGGVWDASATRPP